MAEEKWTLYCDRVVVLRKVSLDTVKLYLALKYSEAWRLENYRKWHDEIAPKFMLEQEGGPSWGGDDFEEIIIFGVEAHG